MFRNAAVLVLASSLERGAEGRVARKPWERSRVGITAAIAKKIPDGSLWTAVRYRIL